MKTEFNEKYCTRTPTCYIARKVCYNLISIDLKICQLVVVQILQIFWKHLTISTIDNFHAKEILRVDSICQHGKGTV